MINPKAVNAQGAHGKLFGLALLTAVALLQAVPVQAQETHDQYNAANAENRRHSETLNQYRIQQHNLRQDQENAMLQCQGAGSASAASACANNVGIGMQQRQLNLDNQFLQEHDNHNMILKGLGVHRVP